MFELFDDTESFTPDDRFRAAVDRRGRQLRRRRRVATGGAAAVVVVALAIGASALYVARRDAAIDRVDVAAQPSTDRAVNVLLLGDDGNGRADTIAVLRIDDTGNRLLSIPRDLVDGDDRRINAGLDGGIQGMVDAVHRTTGIPVDHVVVLDVPGFTGLVDAVGGLDVAVTASLRDEGSGLVLEPSACTTLDGETALQIVRSRHLERFDDGTGAWVPDPTGDLGRIARQQVVLGLALDQFETDPVSIDRFSRLLADHATIDAGLTLARLIELGRRLADGPPLEVATLPTAADQTVDGAAVLVPTDETAAYEQWFGADLDAEPITPSDLTPPMVGVVPIGACPDR